MTEEGGWVKYAVIGIIGIIGIVAVLVLTGIIEIEAPSAPSTGPSQGGSAFGGLGGLILIPIVIIPIFIISKLLSGILKKPEKPLPQPRAEMAMAHIEVKQFEEDPQTKEKPPLVGAKIHYKNLDDPRLEGRGTSKEGGKCILEFPSGKYRLNVGHDDYHPDTLVTYFRAGENPGLHFFLKSKTPPAVVAAPPPAPTPAPPPVVTAPTPAPAPATTAPAAVPPSPPTPEEFEIQILEPKNRKIERKLFSGEMLPPGESVKVRVYAKVKKEGVKDASVTFTASGDATIGGEVVVKKLTDEEGVAIIENLTLGIAEKKRLDIEAEVEGRRLVPETIPIIVDVKIPTIEIVRTDAKKDSEIDLRDPAQQVEVTITVKDGKGEPVLNKSLEITYQKFAEFGKAGEKIATEETTNSNGNLEISYRPGPQSEKMLGNSILKVHYEPLFGVDVSKKLQIKLVKPEKPPELKLIELKEAKTEAKRSFTEEDPEILFLFRRIYQGRDLKGRLKRVPSKDFEKKIEDYEKIFDEISKFSVTKIADEKWKLAYKYEALEYLVNEYIENGIKVKIENEGRNILSYEISVNFAQLLEMDELKSVVIGADKELGFESLQTQNKVSFLEDFFSMVSDYLSKSGIKIVDKELIPVIAAYFVIILREDIIKGDGGKYKNIKDSIEKGGNIFTALSRLETGFLLDFLKNIERKKDKVSGMIKEQQNILTDALKTIAEIYNRNTIHSEIKALDMPGVKKSEQKIIKEFLQRAFDAIFFCSLEAHIANLKVLLAIIYTLYEPRGLMVVD
ncbi:TPA: hypothetical protein H1016_05125 [archaeon]|uniref:Uncharacterized protein n=1 Tax=Candidatus Naiadarchaeum limnaeum TaxID=2756139 RepID=A0A832USV8_9ARCH|nr:hypothetical protein [Candidatus Naiadarchaeum limnaeum]